LNNNLRNLKDDRFQHILSSNDIDKSTTFDLIIIDGKFDDTDFIKAITHENSIIFVEGDRKEQREMLRTSFSKSLISRCTTNKKNYNWGPYQSGFMGGYTLYRLNNRSMKNLFKNYTERIHSGILYRLRKYLKQ
jgi:hypothetical protein